MERLQQETAADAPQGIDQSRHKLQKKLDWLSQTQCFKEVSWVQVVHRKQEEEAHPGSLNSAACMRIGKRIFRMNVMKDLGQWNKNDLQSSMQSEVKSITVIVWFQTRCCRGSICFQAVRKCSDSQRNYLISRTLYSSLCVAPFLLTVTLQ